MSTPASVNLEGALSRFGLTEFRPGQAEVISQIIAGHDCLCVMPTGGGKSLCFQLPTIVRPGLTIVVSPLIALMKDQVDALHRRGIAATLVNSSLTGSEQNQRLQQMAEGKYSLVYVAPERLKNPRFLEAIRATPIQLLAIDEAHCISEWGHDFRPDYARLGKFREWLGGIQTVALTATATPRVRQDILEILKLRSPKQFITGFSRRNLHFAVIPCSGDREKEEEIVRFLQTKPGFGIIYAATRKKCEELAASLSKTLKISLGAYHAGLTIDQRKFIQEQFMKGELQAIVATNAFGMGIDKSDLRYVIHYNMPGSLEAYYQEAGRAGRDGKPSQCVLLYSYQDRYIQEFFIDNSYPPATMVRTIYEYLLEIPTDPIEMTQQEIKENLDLGLSAEAVGTSLQLLSRTGVLERLDAGAGLAMVRISSDLPTLVDLLPKSSERRRKVLRVLERAVGDRRYEAVYVHPRWMMEQAGLERDALHDTLRELCKIDAIEYVPPFRGRAVHFRQREKTFEELEIDFAALDERKRAEYEKLDQMMAFAESKKCRQLSVLQYFGDASAAPCGLCDRCLNRVGWFQIESFSEPQKTKPAAPTKPSEVGGELPAGLVALIRGLLRAVGRTNGRLGKILITQFLAGSENAKLQRLRLHQMPDFASLKMLTQGDIGALMDRLLSAGLLEQKEVNRHRPTVHVSETGRKVAQGEQKIPEGIVFPRALLKKLLSACESAPSPPAAQPPITAPTTPSSEASPQKDPRPSIRTEIGHSVPGPNHTAESDTESERSSHRTSEDHQEKATDGPAKALDGPEKAPELREKASEDWEWTWRMLELGFSLDECAAIRQKSVEEVFHDLERSVRAGRSVLLQKLLDVETLRAASHYVLELKRGDFGGDPLDSNFILKKRPALASLLRAIVGKSDAAATNRPSTKATNPVF